MLLLEKSVFRSKEEGLYETPQLKILNELEITNLLILKAFKILFLCLYVTDLIL